MKKEQYFQFPLFLMRDLLENKEQALNNILYYGAYSFSQKLYSDVNAAAKQLMYEYYRGNLPNDLRNMITKYINDEKIEIDECYYGFSDTVFNPEVEISQLLEIWKTDTGFMNKALEFHKMKLVFNFIGITGNYKYVYDAGAKIHESINPKEPMPMIKKNTLFEYRDNDKTEFELMQLACYIGIRSIIGKKSYCKTNKKMILCRAFGYSSNKNLPEVMPDLYYKYSNRYHIDKVLKSLEFNTWNLHFYSSQMRGLYVGVKNKISLETLVLNAETNKQKNKIQQLNRAKEIARQKALQHLNKEPHLNKEYNMN